VTVYETTIRFKLNVDESQVTDTVMTAIRINLSVKLNVDIIHVSALSFEKIHNNTRRLLAVRASLTVTSFSLAASQNIETALSHGVFNSILASSSNNVLVATNFEVTTKIVGDTKGNSGMLDTTILLILASVGLLCLIAIIILVVVITNPKKTSPARYHTVDVNPMYSPHTDVFAPSHRH